MKQPTKVITNKGEFKIRYVYEKWNPQVGNINVIVVRTEKNDMDGPFTGTYGDEIPMMETYREQYNVQLI